MDAVINWKKILLQWIKECNFLEKNFYSLDQTDIDTFFHHFKDKLKESLNKHDNLSSFLKDQYPCFEPHFDDENSLSSSDHIYVYSLFLHFSCVKCPHTFFQANCQKLNESAQHDITTFFQKLFEEDSLTKETLRRVIASISVFTPPTARVVYSDSPLKTPSKSGISPPTPRSSMLQERTKTVHSLKAQLDTVMYEKSVLETDLRNHLAKIQRLTQDLKKSHQEIIDLRNEMLTRNDESDCEKHTGEEQKSRKFAKIIAQKEAENSKLLETIETLTEQKDILSEKLKAAEKQIKSFQIDINGLSEKVEDLYQELEEKDKTIQTLSDDYLQLEQYVSEIRSSTCNSRPDLNTSSDYIELSRATNSSGSIHSPENLGSVVDIKLREKEQENEGLREEISAIRIDNSKLTKAMNDLTLRYSKLFDICSENLVIDQEGSDPANSFLVLSNYLQNFANKYEDNCCTLNSMQSEVNELRKETSALTVLKASLEKELIESKTNFENCLKERSEEAHNCLNLQKELQVLKSTHTDAEKQIEELGINFANEKEHSTSLQQTVEQLKEKEIQLKQEIVVLTDKLDASLQQHEMEKTSNEKKIADLISVEKNLLEKVNVIEQQNTNLCMKLEKSKQHYDQEKDNLLKSIEDDKERISSLQTKVQTIIIENSVQVAKLEADKEVLITSMQSKVDSLVKTLDDHEGKTQKVIEQNADLTNRLTHSEAELNTRQKNLEEISSAHEKLQELLKELKQNVCDLRSRLLSMMKRNNIEPIEFYNIENIDNELACEVKCLNEDIFYLENAYDNVTKENESMRKHLLELNVKADNLSKNISRLETERVEQISLAEKSTKTEADLRSQLTVMVTSQNKLEADIEAVKVLLSNKSHDTVVLLEKYSEAEKTIAELQAKVVQLENECKTAKDTAEQRVKQLEETRTQLENEVGEKLKLQEEMQNAVRQTEDYRSKVASLETELQKNVDEADKKIDNLKLELDNELTQRNQVKKEIDSAKQAFEDEVRKKRIVEEQLVEAKLQLGELTTTHEAIEEDFKNMKLQFESKMKETKNDFESVKLQLESEAKEKETVKEILESVKSQLERVTSEKRDLQEDLENLKVQFENEAKENHHVKESFESLKSKLESEISEKEKLQENLASLQIQFKKEKQQVKDNLECVNVQLEREASDKQKLHEDLESLKVQLKSKATEKQLIQDNFESVKLQLEQEASEKLKLQEDLKKSVALNLHIETAKCELETEVKQVKEDLEKARLQLRNAITEKDQIKEELHSVQEEIKRHLEDKRKLEEELEKMRSKIFLMESEFDTTNEEAKLYAEEQRKNFELAKLNLEEDFENARKEMNELRNQKLVLESNLQEMAAVAEKNRIELQSAEAEVNRLKSEETKLLSELELIKSSTETDLKMCNKEIDQQKENVSRLIKELTCARQEKERIENERNKLIEQHRLFAIDHNSIVEKLQSAEKESFVKQTVLKAEQTKTKDLESQLKQLQMENVKLKETAEINMKRIENLALKLGETQAKCQKLRKEAESAQSSLETNKSSMETIQRENSKISLEYKSLKDKLSKCERTIDQLTSTIQNLEQQNEQLRTENKNLETSENDLKTSNTSLEKIKSNLEEKVRKLVKSLSDSNVAVSRLDQEKVQLSLEIGGLNKQLQETNELLKRKSKEIEEITTSMIEVKNKNILLVELNEKQQIDANEIIEENSRLNDQLSKLSLRLQLTQESHESVKTELENLRFDILATKQERDAMEKAHRTTLDRLVSIEGLYEEQRSTDNEFLSKIESLEAQLSKTTMQLRNLEENRNKDKNIIQQLNDDISIFKAKLQKSRSMCEEKDKKWAEEKEQLLGEVKESEERIKETRLELEGKLEKMKNKMKTLYNDEITKMKKKQERELVFLTTDLDAFKAKNEKHEEHIKKLSNQIFRLNENILEYQKENTFLKTKLKDLESKPRALSRVKSASGISASNHHQVLSSNLHMEDEEGEVFNNTYLSDLKNGRMSEHFNTDICAQELQYRNSLLPPHLKSTYLAQFDHQMGEDEIRDTPSLDDSMSTLLNTGQRKKMSGATSYKRPGPPTPSKNAGRLSFGGIGELNREILKESLDNGPSSSKTPAKFKLFSSKLSIRDEPKNHVTAFKQKQHLLGVVQCSSTPRKSKAHCDQRRLLDQIMLTATPGSDYASDCIVSPAVNLPSSLKSLELTRRMSWQKWRQPKQTYATDSGNSDVNSPKIKEYKYSANGRKQSNKRLLKDRRASIHLRGNMFARNCRTPTVGAGEIFKKKSKMQRIANFNKYRKEMLNEVIIKRASLCCEFDSENNKSISCSLEEMQVVEKSSFCDENEYNDDTCQHFKQLLEVKESNAPFEISEFKKGPSPSNVHSSSSNVHSRTIYGTSVILNRRIPHVNTTMVRKSSIYVKGQDGQSLILVTNQTITLMDLAQMWIQMNVSAKSFIAFSFVAMFVGIFSFTIPLFR